MNRRAALQLVLLGFFFVVVRVLILDSYLPKLAFEDELGIGVIAKDLLGRPVLPLFDYKSDFHTHGVIPMGIVTTPFFALFGDSYASLKLVAVGFGLGTMLVWYLLCYRYLGEKVALAVGLIHCLPPPGYTCLSLMTLGNHCEANLLTAAAFYLFLRVLERGDAVRRAVPYWLLAAFGLLSGFSLWFYYPFAIVLLSCLAVFAWVRFAGPMCRSDLRWPGAAVFLLCLLVGFSPWIYDNVRHHFEGLNVVERPLVSHFFSGGIGLVLKRMTSFFATDLPAATYFARVGPVPAQVLSWGWYLIVVALAIIAFVRYVSAIGWCETERSPAELTVVVLIATYVALFSLVVWISDFRIGPAWVSYLEYRYLAPLFPPVAALAAAALGSTSCRDTAVRGGTRAILALFSGRIRGAACRVFSVLPVAMVGLLVVAGLAGNLPLIRWHDLGIGRVYKGYSYYQLGTAINLRVGSDLGKAVGVIERAPEEKRDDLYRALGVWYALRFAAVEFDGRTQSESIGTIRKSIPPQRRCAFVEGIGSGITPVCSRSYVRQIERLCACLPAEFRRPFVQGAGRAAGAVLCRKVRYHLLDVPAPPSMTASPEELATLFDAFAGNETEDFLRGFALGAAADFFFDVEALTPVFASLPRRHADALWAAFAAAAVREFGESNVRTYLAPRMPPSALAGLESN